MGEGNSGWLNKLKDRWQLKSLFQVVVVLIVFALTGFTVLFLKKPILNIFGDQINESWLYSLLYYVLILPIYQVVLLIYAFLLGQFEFFWAFEKRFFNRIFGKSGNKKKPLD